MNEVKRRPNNSLVLQGSILAAAAIVSRIIGFIYRIPLANMLTDVGNGYYGNASNIYALFLMISTFGFPLAISKLISERLQEKKYHEAQEIFRAAMILAIILGLVSAIALWFLAIPLSQLMGSKLNLYAIRALSPALLVFAILAVIRGYFQGMNNMVPTAFSQIIEQVFNAIFSIALAVLLFGKGIPYAAMGGTLGTGIGAFFALLLMGFVYYATSQTIIKSRLLRDQHINYHHPLPFYWKKILALSIPMIIGVSIVSFTGVLDSLMIQRALIFKGFTELEAIALNGVYMMKHQPLITLPVSIASSFAAACVPSLAAASVLKGQDQSLSRILSAIKITLLVSIPAAVGFFVLGKPITQMLFTQGNLELAGKLLQVGAISIVFFSLSAVAIGILQGLGKLKMTVYTSLIGMVVKVVVNLILILGLNLNIYGAILANVAFSVVLAALNLQAVYHIVHFKLDIGKTIVYPLVSAVVMGSVSWILYLVLSMITKSIALSTLISIPLGAMIYLYLLILLNCLDEKEIMEFPKGTQLVKILKKLHLI